MIIGNNLQLNDFPARNTPAIVKLLASPRTFYAITSIICSYSDIPVGGRLTVDDGGTSVLDIDICTTAGEKIFDLPMYSEVVDSLITVTLAAGGQEVSGKLMVSYYINSQ